MSDGVLLATDVYRPGPGRWPVLLLRLPYDKTGDEFFVPDIATWLVERGFAVVAQDVRGKARSAGRFVPYVNEPRDGYDTVSWIVEQPWSDGHVGAIGDSYAGFAAWATAASGHRAVRAVAARACSIDMVSSLSPAGVLQLERLALWALETLPDETLYDGLLDWSVRPLADIVPNVVKKRLPALDALAAGTARGRLRPRRTFTVPALHLGGWWDVVRFGQFATWRAAHAAAAPQLLHVAATDHAWLPVAPPGAIAPNPRATPRSWEEFLRRYMEPVADFFESLLSARHSRPRPPVTWQLTWQGWHESASWPPADATTLCLYLHPGANADSEGALAARPPRRLRAFTWNHDPARPVASLGNPFWTLAAPPDASKLLRHPDLSSFVTEPLDAALDLCGPSALEVTIRSTAPSTHLVASLVDVYPDGRRMIVTEACGLVQGPWPGTVHLDVGDVGYRIRAGHRLGLHLCSSCFPAYALHPGTDDDPWFAERFHPSRQHLTLGGRQPAAIQLTVRKRNGRGR